MQPEILLEEDTEIRNESNVSLAFRKADKIDLKDVINIEKLSSLLKLLLLYVALWIIYNKGNQTPKTNFTTP